MILHGTGHPLGERHVVAHAVVRVGVDDVLVGLSQGWEHPRLHLSVVIEEVLDRIVGVQVVQVVALIDQVVSLSHRLPGLEPLGLGEHLLPGVVRGHVDGRHIARHVTFVLSFNEGLVVLHDGLLGIPSGVRCCARHIELHLVVLGEVHLGGASRWLVVERVQIVLLFIFVFKSSWNVAPEIVLLLLNWDLFHNSIVEIVLLGDAKQEDHQEEKDGQHKEEDY